jgi:hypothetical protein
MAMRIFFLFLSIVISVIVFAQEDRDTLLSRCPIYITDTVSANNFFLEFQPSTIKVYRVKGNLTIAIQQRDQFFTLFFNDNKLKDRKYKILKGANNNSEVAAKYSFRSGQQVSYVDVFKGTVESSFDKEKDMWNLKVNGLIANLVERSVTYYRVKADLYIR